MICSTGFSPASVATWRAFEVPRGQTMSPRKTGTEQRQVAPLMPFEEGSHEDESACEMHGEAIEPVPTSQAARRTEARWVVCEHPVNMSGPQENRAGGLPLARFLL